MFRQIILTALFALVFTSMATVNALVASDESHWAPLLDAAFEKNDLEMAVLVLVNDNNVPVSDIIVKARAMGFSYTRIVDALAGTNLSPEQVILDALQNNVPPKAVFDSDKICGDQYGYTPESILRLLVKNLRFLTVEEENLGEKEENQKTKQKNLEIVLAVCKSMMSDKDFTKYDIIFNLCQASASHETVNKASERFDVPTATTLKACPQHAEYGHEYTSNKRPEEAHIVIGVDHLTIDDNAGRGNGVISPKAP